MSVITHPGEENNVPKEEESSCGVVIGVIVFIILAVGSITWLLKPSENKDENSCLIGSSICWDDTKKVTVIDPVKDHNVLADLDKRLTKLEWPTMTQREKCEKKGGFNYAKDLPYYRRVSFSPKENTLCDIQGETYMLKNNEWVIEHPASTEILQP